MMRYMEREKPKRSAFHRCVVKCFLGHDDPAGDLAYDMARDDFFPEDDNYDAVYDYLVYLCWKFTSPGTSGVPDRIVLMPKGRIAFVETKAPGDVPRKIQLKRHKQLRALGFQVYVLDDKKDIAELVHKIGSDDP